MTNKPTMLVILDGFGYRKEKHGNAIINAKMPFLQTLFMHYPTALLQASGQAVGLLNGFIGNSEVGHLTLGAGRTIPSMLSRIHQSIDSGDFAKNPVLLRHFSELKQSGSALHLLGLLSDGGVHSHEKHLFALLAVAKKTGLKNVFIHPILDGRDVAPRSASLYMQRLDAACTMTTTGIGTIASIQGRFYAMDRDNNWDRTQLSYNMLCGITSVPQEIIPWQSVLDNAYKANTTDEFVIPQLLNPTGFIKPGDGVLFFNFRPDRARQLTEAFINPHFSEFSNPVNTSNKTLSFFTTATRYKEAFALFSNDVLFESEKIEHTLLDEIMSQQQASPPPVFIIAETEKYAHVTYFFRGMREDTHPHETRVLIPSIKTKNYVNHPEMSAPAITSTLVRSLRSNPAYFYVVNYANADMVGHSGNFDATVKACESLDQQIALLHHEVVERAGGTLIITADHGNAEEKMDPEGHPLTAHTTNPVPFVFVSKQKAKHEATTPFHEEPVLGLAHVAPTILKHLGLRIPAVMEQETII